MKTVVSEKGQITIPKSLRDRLGLRPGTQLDFTASNGKLIGKKIETDEDRVLAVTGVAEKTINVDKYLESVRGKPD